MTDSGFSSRPARRLTLYLCVRDRVHHHSLEVDILRRARRARLAGATVFEGQAGFGASGELHREHLTTDDRPLALVFIDEPDRISSFFEQIGPELSGRGLVAVVEDIEVLEL
jgi:PII-like signaling protein